MKKLSIFPLVAALFLATSYKAAAAGLPKVPVNGGSVAGVMEYKEHGSKDGEPIILIQGSIWADAFLPVAMEPALQKHRVLRVHLRGYGGSSLVKAPFGVSEHAEDIIDLLHQLGIARAHLVGHSYGGSIALEVAKKAPDLVQSLVLAEPGESNAVAKSLGMPDETWERTEEKRNGIGETPEEREAFEDLLLRVMLGDKNILEEKLPGAYQQAATHGFDAFAVQLESGPDSMGTFDPEQDLPKMPQPILFIVGSGPERMDYANLVRKYHANTEILKLPDMPHLFTILQPAWTAQAIAEFVEGQHSRN